LLLRFGIIAGLHRKAVLYRETRREAWQLEITHRESLYAFQAKIGIFGKEEALNAVLKALDGKGCKPSRDTIPEAVWLRLEQAKGEMSWAALAERSGSSSRTNLHVGKRGLSRPRLRRFAETLSDQSLLQLADSEVYWDEIVSIEPMGMKQVYDLTIEGTH